MPGVLMRSLEIARTVAHGCGYRDGIISVLRQDASQQLRHPFLDRVRVRVDQGADAEDGCVALTDRFAIARRLARWWDVALLCQIDEAVLKREDATFG